MVDRVASASSHSPGESAKCAPRFRDLHAAGAHLAQVLRQFDLTNALVLAIANAGAPVGREVADQLKLPLDVLIIRRLLAPSGSGSELCAVNAAGTLVLDDQMNIPADPVTPQEHFILQALSELRQRANASRGDRPPMNLTGQQILLVDCAIHTGSTMRIAIRALRKLKPARVVSAVPVAARQPYAEIATMADEAVTLAQPEPFGHAGMWYDDFNRPGDERVRDLLITR